MAAKLPPKTLRYENARPGAQVVSAEFSSISGDTLAFLKLSDAADGVQVKQWLETLPEERVVSDTHGDDGSRFVVCRGKASSREVLDALAQHGEALAMPAPEKKGFNPWMWRGMLSIIGQSLQLTSSFLNKTNASDRAAIYGFAGLNMTANAFNIIFGSQKKDDPYQLRELKSQFNDQIAPLVEDASKLPGVEDHCAARRQAAKKTAGAQTYETLQKYSVSGGEIGLRTLGAASLAFPVTSWGKAWRTLSETKSIGKAFGAVRNSNPVTFYAGLATLAGKFTSMAAKEPDPFNPQPASGWDKFRENIAFRLSSVIEGVAAGFMTVDRFRKQKITVNGKTMPDYPGGVGNGVFVGGYIIRFTAPYGSLEVDMPELYAHISDGLAQVPREHLPRLLAETAESLAEHFKAKKISFADIYGAIAEDMEKQHGIRIEAPAVPQQQVPAPALPESLPLPAATLVSQATHQHMVQPELNTKEMRHA